MLVSRQHNNTIHVSFHLSLLLLSSDMNFPLTGFLSPQGRIYANARLLDNTAPALRQAVYRDWRFIPRVEVPPRHRRLHCRHDAGNPGQGLCGPVGLGQQGREWALGESHLPDCRGPTRLDSWVGELIHAESEAFVGVCLCVSLCVCMRRSGLLDQVLVRKKSATRCWDMTIAQKRMSPV